MLLMVKKLDLGPLRNLSSALSAEGDRNIAEYFVETGRMEDIKSGTQLVLGRKGSGKTALFLHAVNDLEDKDRVVVKLDLSRSYPIESQILFEDKGVVEHERYVRGWKFVLCLSLYLAWVDKRVLSPRERRVLKRLKNKISRIDGVESIWEWMVKSFEVKVGPFFHLAIL